MSSHPVLARVATSTDIDAIVDTLTKAFFHDPLWGPAFPDAEHRTVQWAAVWRLYATSALRHGWLLVTQNVEAVAVWIPPGGDELTPREAAGLKDFLERAANPAVARTVLAMAGRFGAARPDEPHFYLTLLGRHDRHRGQGLGMGSARRQSGARRHLGRSRVPGVFQPGEPRAVRKRGLRPRDRITTATGHVVTTMWRPAR